MGNLELSESPTDYSEYVSESDSLVSKINRENISSEEREKRLKEAILEIRTKKRDFEIKLKNIEERLKLEKKHTLEKMKNIERETDVEMLVKGLYKLERVRKKISTDLNNTNDHINWLEELNEVVLKDDVSIIDQQLAMKKYMMFMDMQRNQKIEYESENSFVRKEITRLKKKLKKLEKKD